jgi:serine/threonine-protein kinase RsbT
VTETGNLYERKFTVEGGDFGRAGKVSSAIKKILKEIGFPQNLIKRVVIIAYEAEINVVSYADRGDVDLIINQDSIVVKVEDEGVGISDIELAMQEGYSTAPDEIREMGFGAGMGLPNIRKNSDNLEITSEVGKGTCLTAKVNTN